MTRMDSPPTVVAAAFGELHSVANPVLSELVAAMLECSADQTFCFVQIRRTDGEHTLLIDADWMELAEEVDRIAPISADDFDAPANAVKAVIQGWPESWQHWDGSALDVHWSDGDIPYVGSVARSRSN